MKKLFTLSLCSSLFAAAISSCNPNNNPTPNNPSTPGFKWKVDNGSELTADSAKWTTGSWGTGIRAWKDGSTHFFEINWDANNNTSVGAKTLTTPYGFTYLEGSNNYVINTQSTLNVTAFSNNKLSGDFSVQCTGPNGNATVSGTFSEIPAY